MRPLCWWQIPIILSVFARPCAAQRGLQLEPTESVLLEHTLQFWGAPQLQCDSEGNLFILAHSAEDSSKDYMLKVSPHGEETRQIDPRAVAELHGFRISTVFTPGPHGEIFLFTSKNVSEGTSPQGVRSQATGEKEREAEVYIASFDRGGNLISNAKLDYQVEPKAIAAFNSGELLVAGVVSSFKQDSESERQEPFAGIFSRDGLLLQTVNLAKSTQTPQEGSNTQDGGADSEGLDTTNMPRAGSADNGSVYLMQRQLQGPVFLLISSEGKVLHTIKISSPERAKLRDVRFAQGKLVAAFMRTIKLPGNPKGVLATDSEIFQILNIENGEKIREYERRRPFLGNLACYASDALTFLRVGENRRFELVRAEIY